MHGDACLSVKELQASMTYQYSKEFQEAFMNRGAGGINQIRKLCSSKWTRNVLLGILLVICHLTKHKQVPS